MVCLELTPPSPITTRHLGEQLLTGVVCNETHSFSAAGSHEIILSSSIAFQQHHKGKVAICRNDPIQKESWVNIAPLSRGMSLTSLSSSRTYTTWSKMAQVVPCFLRTRSITLQFSSSYQPYSLPYHGIISGFKHQPITTHKQALKVCATKLPWLLRTCISFPDHYWPSRSLENQPTNQTRPKMCSEVQLSHWKRVII